MEETLRRLEQVDELQTMMKDPANVGKLSTEAMEAAKLRYKGVGEHLEAQIRDRFPPRQPSSTWVRRVRSRTSSPPDDAPPSEISEAIKISNIYS